MNGTQFARLERLWPFYRLARIAFTAVAGAAMLLVIDDFLETKPTSAKAYAQRVMHIPYVQGLYDSAPVRLKRMASKAKDWAKQQIEKL